MTSVAGVFDHFQGLPLTPPGIEVLDGRKLDPGDVLSRQHCVFEMYNIQSDVHRVSEDEIFFND